MKLQTISLLLLAGMLPSTVFAAETISYSYDARGRVIKVEHSGTTNNGVKTEYIIDKADNRSNAKTTGAPG